MTAFTWLLFGWLMRCVFDFVVWLLDSSEHGNIGLFPTQNSFLQLSVVFTEDK